MNTQSGQSGYAKQKSPEFALALAIFETIREPGRQYTYRQLGAALGVSRTTIYKIERQAVAKMHAYWKKMEATA